MAGDFETRLRGLCLEVIREKGWNPFNDISVEVIDSPFPILAYINMTTRQITLKVDAKLEQSWEQIEKKHKFHEPEFLRTLVYFIVLHEYSHHKICPFSKERYELILSGIYEALKTRELRKEKLEAKIMTIHNLFSDTIINTLNAHTDINKEAFKKGLFIAYMLMGFYQKKTKKFFKPRFDKGMTLFISSNFSLCQIDAHPHIDSYYARYSYERVRAKIITVFSGDEKETLKIVSGENSLATVARMGEHLLWKDMAFKYATIIYPFVNQPYRQLQNSFDGKEGPSSGAPSGSQSEVKDFVDKQEDAPKIPFWDQVFLDYDALDKLYRERAGIVILQAESKILNTPTYEHYVGSEETSLSDFSPKRIEWGATRISKKTIELHQREFNLDFEFDSESKEIPNLPDMAFIFDSSISMEFHPFESKGQYHFAALAFYSILKDLEMKNIAHMLQYNMINFSMKTVSSGWCPYSNIEKVKRSLFQYQGLGTALDPMALQDLRTQRHDNCIVFMLSDTGFNETSNVYAVLNEIEKFDRGIAFYLFQLGSPSMFSEALEKMGYPVHPVESAEDFMEKTINFTRDKYEVSSPTR